MSNTLVELAGHLIKRTEIVGIGPLINGSISTQSSTKVTFYFFLHLRHQSIKIESTWINNLMITSEMEKKSMLEEMEAWKKAYNFAKETVRNAVDSDLP